MHCRSSLLLLLPLWSAHAIASQATSAGPNGCLDATPSCTESIGITGQSKRLTIYRTHSLAKPAPAVTRAFILVHGILRDADSHFRTAIAGAFLAGKLADTIIIAPRFASNTGPGTQAGGCHDALAADEANWLCDSQRPDTWRSGGPAIGADTVTSFDFLDALVAKVADQRLFPNLKTIVVAGHSAGGQFVMRYAMASTQTVRTGVSVSYIVANPSSYAYLDEMRPVGRNPPMAAIATGSQAGLAVAQRGEDDFGPFADAKNCTGYDDWPYGLQHRIGYAARIDIPQLVHQYRERSITYLLGDADVLPSGVFDTSCPAMAQGSSRFARGMAFARYMHDRFGTRHDTVVVPFCSHSVRCMFTADVSAPVMFPQ